MEICGQARGAVCFVGAMHLNYLVMIFLSYRSLQYLITIPMVLIDTYFTNKHYMRTGVQIAVADPPLDETPSSLSEMREAVRKSKGGIAAGVSSISAEMLKAVGEAIIHGLEWRRWVSGAPHSPSVCSPLMNELKYLGMEG